MGKGIVKLGEGQWAVKDGNLLAAKETNGRFKNAEFTVSRGTRATYVGRDGLIKESNLQDVNLVTNGAFDTDSDWVKQSSWTIANGAANSNGTGLLYQTSVSYVDGKTYKVTFDASITSGGGTVRLGNTSSSTAFTNGTNVFYLQTDASNTTRYIFFQGNSFEGSIDNVSVQEVKTDTPRIDFTDNTDGHLLLEPESTNLLPYSEDFSEWALVNGTILPNATASPSGEINADKFTFISGYAQLRYTLTVASTTQYSASFYVKNLDATNVEYRVYDVTNGTDILSSSYYSQISNTEWTRVSFEFNTSATTSSIYFYPIAGSYSGSLYIWGAQVEALSYATSYIPCNGGTVTRDAETCLNAGETADFNSEEGVLYAEIAALANDGTTRRISITDGTSNNRINISYHPQNNYIQSFGFVNGAVQFVFQLQIPSTTSFNKIAVKYKVNDCALWINGVEVATDTSANTWANNTLNNLSFTNNPSSSLETFYGKCKAIRVYKEALSDTDLENLTS